MSQVSYLEGELANLSILIEYGKEAWAADIANQEILLQQATRQLHVAESELAVLKSKHESSNFEKELRLVETDLFNYIRNNEKTLIGLKRAERTAFDMYTHCVNTNTATESISQTARNLLTEL